MQIVRTIAALRDALVMFRDARDSVALVPTMGALHPGHLALVEEARRRARRVVVSIFVNPTQFGPNEDLAAYPRREATDVKLLDDGGCDLLWLPSVEEMYPAGAATTITVRGVSEGLCGAARPGHFDGVATVVAKLFNQVRPDAALFGEKDYQQLAVIRQMNRDLDFGIDVIGVATQREDDGLARSSRNIYLSDANRAVARALPRALGEAARAIQAGGDVAAILDHARSRIVAGGFDSVEYVELRDAATLEPMTVLDRDARILAAARLGGTRLIDNLAVPAA
ncbi:MAG: pantothenate synthetase [Sphingomonas bacterium]|nr:pantoate--beta-alanine ligase [Sphingomonas bacterium]MDB5689076.1 pantothenate synthetase [Sphingomonas bacterium]